MRVDFKIHALFFAWFDPPLMPRSRIFVGCFETSQDIGGCKEVGEKSMIDGVV
ncbi:hypothetical protein J1N35_020836, partial [Gossypium stocksii]